MKKLELKGEFKIDQDKRTIAYFQTSKGMNMSGVARCGEEDEFNVEYGKALAFFRYELAVRERDRAGVAFVRDFLQTVVAQFDSAGKTKRRPKLFDRYLADAWQQFKIQTEHLRQQELICKVMSDPEEAKKYGIDLFDKNVFPDAAAYIQKLYRMILEASKNDAK